jgi:hypothetical protein
MDDKIQAYDPFDMTILITCNSEPSLQSPLEAILSCFVRKIYFIKISWKLHVGPGGFKHQGTCLIVALTARWKIKYPRFNYFVESVEAVFCSHET